MTKYDISIHLEVPELKLRRENDKFIMEIFSDAQAKKRQIQDLNRYRIGMITDDLRLKKIMSTI